ncbi:MULTISPECIES: MFS transporter [unclassified Shinella]|uniref:MFS transporter n=1 Tax=unclassified Shinella TaxID=2643062 RepID=UPI00225C5CF7|nr:MFS transporter [Shinella sp. YE25]MDC7259551.1 MFS transporter [Shinella sp. YE25]CAI0341329.1 membrane hypothetical protein [Rhizobiaceae bacterium]CAK7260966.1 membrane protein of unknown function [Shinella sp. WSC3-e]
MVKPEGWLAARKGRSTLLLFFAGMLVSNVGRNAYFVCLTWIALTKSNSVRLVTVLLFASTLVQFLSSGISGHLADVIDRRRLAVGFDVVRTLVVALTGYAVTAEAGLWALFLSVALYSVADRGYLTSMQSMIPDLTLRTSAIAANSASYLMMQVGTFLGALLAGYLLHAIPYGVGLSSIAVTFAISVIVLYAARMELRAPATATQYRANLLSQLFSIKQLTRNRLIGSAACYGLTLGLAALFSSLLAAYVLKEMKGGAVQFGQMESAWALGATVACLLLSIGVGKSLTDLSLAPLLFLSGVGLILLWMFPGPASAATTLVALGVIYNVNRILVDARV